MLKIWGRTNSINVQKVLWTCDELALEYERTDAAGAFGFPDDFVNPNKLVPAISGDGFELWESNAIVRYLARKHAVGTLSPENLEHLADADRWMDWQATTLWNGIRPVFWGLVRTPPEERDEEAIEAARKQTEAAWDILEAEMSGKEYVTGDSFTIADIPLGASIHRWHALDVERKPRPNVDGWYERLKERPAYMKNVVEIPLK
ncbi:MAG: glutathione S-transferase [Actinomycetota bacterium]|jgi:glutathione S-transferase|nr:glutathione S-transferase [Actinomycetota bacterium]